MLTKFTNLLSLSLNFEGKYQYFNIENKDWSDIRCLVTVDPDSLQYIGLGIKELNQLESLELNFKNNNITNQGISYIFKGI